MPIYEYRCSACGHAKGIITIAGNDALLIAQNLIIGDKDSGRLEIRDGGNLSCVEATLANEPGAHATRPTLQIRNIAKCLSRKCAVRGGVSSN